MFRRAKDRELAQTCYGPLSTRRCCQSHAPQSRHQYRLFRRRRRTFSERFGSQRPIRQSDPADSQRVVHVLIRTSSVAIDRDGKAVNAELGLWCCIHAGRLARPKCICHIQMHLPHPMNLPVGSTNAPATDGVARPALQLSRKAF
jgi:hypothetical protein